MKLTEDMLSLGIDEVRPNPHQPRSYFDEGKIRIMAQSIQEHGLETPMQFVWKPGDDGKKASIKDGELRYRALKMAGITKLIFGTHYLYKEVDSDEEMELGALIANCMREDLSPVEKGKAIMSLMKRKGIKSRKVAICSLNRAKEYIDNDFLSEPTARNFFIQADTIKDIARYMKAIGISGTNAVDLLQILELPVDIQEKVYFATPNTKISRDAMKISRFGKLVKREKNDQGRKIPIAHANELSRLDSDQMVRFFLKKAYEQQWSSKRLNIMVTDYLDSKMTPDAYIMAYGARRVSASEKAARHDLNSLTTSMDHMASTLTSFRTINLVALAPEFNKKSIAISATGLRKATERLQQALDEVLCNAVQLQKIKTEKRVTVIDKSFTVSLGTSPHIDGPAYRFSLPTDLGRALQEQHELEQGDSLELKVMTVIKKGVACN
jgi:ParB/RepB/Spo0J family partition protein